MSTTEIKTFPIVLAIGLALLGLLLMGYGVLAHDKTHSDQTPAMKNWFESLKSGKGPCCSDADGSVIKDADWEADEHGHYRVFINGAWLDVPDEAVLRQPNLYGPTMVWMGVYLNGIQQVRCFIPGNMT